MIPPTCRDWLLAREPSLPGAFLPHLLGEGRESREVDGVGRGQGGRGSPAGAAPVREDPDVAEGLMEAAHSAFDEAVRVPGARREAAFRLLAGDAFLTYACETALEEVDPGTVLEELLARVGRRFG